MMREDSLPVFQELMSDESYARTAQSPYIWVWANLGIGENEEALRLLNTIADAPGPQDSIWRVAVIRNLSDDPILDQPEFVEVRRRLGFRG